MLLKPDLELLLVLTAACSFMNVGGGAMCWSFREGQLVAT